MKWYCKDDNDSSNDDDNNDNNCCVKSNVWRIDALELTKDEITITQYVIDVWKSSGFIIIKLNCSNITQMCY